MHRQEKDKKKWAKLKPRASEFRKNMTSAEAQLWGYLRRKKMMGLRFHRQHVLGPFILDFYCRKHQIAIEVDGDIHLTQKERDIERTMYLNSRGISVIRLNNNHIVEEPQRTLEWLRQQIIALLGEGLHTRSE